MRAVINFNIEIYGDSSDQINAKVDLIKKQLNELGVKHTVELVQ